MKITKTEKREIVFPVTTETFCDKCDKSIYPDNNFEFTFLAETRSQYFNISVVRNTLDLCPECLESMLSLLKENNYRVQTKEY